MSFVTAARQRLGAIALDQGMFCHVRKSDSAEVLDICGQPRDVRGLHPFTCTSGPARFPRNLRAPHARDAYQFRDPIDGCQSAAMCRSAFGKIYVYNLLPTAVAELPTVKAFEKMLQQGLKKACRTEVPAWNFFLSDGPRRLSAVSFQQMFS